MLPLLTILYLRLLPPFGLLIQAQLHEMTKVMVEVVEQA
jgi:hypothetical protein